METTFCFDTGSQEGSGYGWSNIPNAVDNNLATYAQTVIYYDPTYWSYSLIGALSSLKNTAISGSYWSNHLKVISKVEIGFYTYALASLADGHYVYHRLRFSSGGSYQELLTWNLVAFQEISFDLRWIDVTNHTSAPAIWTEEILAQLRTAVYVAYPYSSGKTDISTTARVGSMFLRVTWEPYYPYGLFNFV